MSNFLAVDASSHYLTVLAVKGEKKVLKYIPDCALQHSVKIMGEIESALDGASLTCAECDYFAAVTGPGSFTGIRIGISTVKGLALASGKPMAGITSFGLIAYNVKDKKFYTVIDAAHGHYYVSGYENGETFFEPAYLSEAEVEKLDAPLYGFENLPFKNYIKLDAGGCLYQAAAAQAENLSGTLSALYVRKSQAEEGRK